MKIAIKQKTVRMLNRLPITFYFLITASLISCNRSSSDSGTGTTPPAKFNMNTVSVDGFNNASEYVNTSVTPSIRISFSAPLKNTSVASAVSIIENAGTAVAFNTSFQNNDSTLVITPVQPLKFLTRYSVTVTTLLKSKSEGQLQSPVNFSLFTKFDFSDKFPRISDDQLLTLIQRQTFTYFWDFGHPISGLARERNNSGDLVTSGGSGFGIMAIITAIHRNFITRAEGLARMQKIVDFLKNKADKFHGAFPHWLNGTTGKVIPFSTKDNGADLVETAFLMQGLLTARQFFSDAGAAETSLRNDITAMYNAVEWNWFRKGSEDVLYWHWSPDYQWEMNHPVRGWNEALIVYVLAASSPTYSIPKTVYDAGWAQKGAISNGNSYYGIQLPLGPPNGGPLFFAHYSFLGMNPNNLKDTYANYWTQNVAHSLINYNYCKTNPRGFYGYSDSCWGLTASDDPNGYLAHEPNNDNGTISPTAALSSFPYTPTESMKALKFFYYKLGDKIWKEYGFVDAFNLNIPWFANSFLAIDQGPIIVMIENYRSGVLWNLFMSNPEVKKGLRDLGFQSPYL
jgi:hypothetical protein